MLNRPARPLTETLAAASESIAPSRPGAVAVRAARLEGMGTWTCEIVCPFLAVKHLGPGLSCAHSTAALAMSRIWVLRLLHATLPSSTNNDGDDSPRLDSVHAGA